MDVRTLPLDRVGLLRAHHRLALPFLAPAFSHLTVDAEVAICSSSGWAHGAKVTGRKIVYCHTPARWLYQSGRYLDGTSALVGRGAVGARPAAAPAGTAGPPPPPTATWSTPHAVRLRVEELYGIEAAVVPPPVDVDPDGELEPVDGVQPGFVLCVSRLLPYKNVEAVDGGLPPPR